MSTHLIWGSRKDLLDHLQVQQVIGTTSDKYAQTSRQHIDERSCIAIQAVQTKEHRGWGKPELGGIAGDHLCGSSQFASVIPIARPTKGAQKLMRMRLEDDGAGAHHFSPLAPLVARRANVIKTAMRGWQ